jgi:hypothetical protein
MVINLDPATVLDGTCVRQEAAPTRLVPQGTHRLVRAVVGIAIGALLLVVVALTS